MSEAVAKLSGTLDLVQSLLFDDEPPSSLAETAYRELRARIISLQLRPGQPLPENGLKETLGLGRTPIREALSRLVAERLVVVRPRRGVFVSEISLPDLGGVYEVRIHLEGLAGRLAAVRTADSDPRLISWTDQLDELEAAVLDYGELLAVDYRMHQKVYGLSRNPYLQRDLTRYLNLSVRLILAVSERGSLPIEELSHTVADFRELFEAIRAHDAETADALARAHVDSSEAMVRGRA